MSGSFITAVLVGDASEEEITETAEMYGLTPVRAACDVCTREVVVDTQSLALARERGMRVICSRCELDMDPNIQTALPPEMRATTVEMFGREVLGVIGLDEDAVVVGCLAWLGLTPADVPEGMDPMVFLLRVVMDDDRRQV